MKYCGNYQSGGIKNYHEIVWISYNLINEYLITGVNRGYQRRIIKRNLDFGR